MSSILLPILIASFIGYQLDELKMKQYDMINEKGENVKVQFSKNGKYSCPLNCSLNHYHYATLNDDSCKSSDLWKVDSHTDHSGVNTYQVNGLNMSSYVLFESKKSKAVPTRIWFF